MLVLFEDMIEQPSDIFRVATWRMTKVTSM